MLQDIIESRKLLWMLVKRELRSRYAGSNIGAFWNLIHPIVLIGIYVLIFSSLMGTKMGADNSRLGYTIHLCAGIIPWFLFSEIISRCSSVLMENSNLLKKLALPQEVLFLSVFITSLIVHSISLLALMILLLLMGVSLSPVVLFAYPILVALGLTALGIGMMLSVVTLFVRDIGQVTQIVLQLLFWSLPIVYPISIITSEKILFLLGLNPLRGFFSLIQLLFGADQSAFNNDSYWIIILLPFAMMVMGMRFLKANYSEILDTL